MYGLIGIAVKKLVETELGTSSWERICERANFSEKDFIKADSYEDKLIFDIVNEVSKESGISVSDIFVKFGHYWIDFAISEGYGDAYKLGGDTFVSFLGNLNKLHTYVATTFPNLQPPHFLVNNDTGRSLQLTYRSTRNGLEDMVVGLVEALGLKFGLDVVISKVSVNSDKVVFNVKYT